MKYNIYDLIRKEDMFLVWGALFVVATAIFCSVVDPFYKKNTESYNQKYSQHLITCYQCKGTGQYPTDVNKLMMEASITLFVNHHLMVDRCEKCVKLESGDYRYCDEVNDRYTTLLKQYAILGPKIEMADCDKCMGMGRFTCQKPDGSYMTQEEYNKKYQTK